MKIRYKRMCALYVASILFVVVLKVNKTSKRAPLEGMALRIRQTNATDTDSTDCGLSASTFTALFREQGSRSAKFSKRSSHFHGQIYVDSRLEEKSCPNLYKVAREMLRGTKIKLPSETKHTRWKFKERESLDVLSRTKLHWKPPWKTSNIDDMMKKFQRYNVSARTIGARKLLLTYGHNCCEKSKETAVNEAINAAKVDYAEALDLSDLSVPFQISHRKVLRRRKGAGYWLWKPYIILKTLLTKMKNGDMLIYQDAGSHFVQDAGPLFKLCKEAKHNILSFHMLHQESEYSKRDAFVLMDMDDRRVYQKGQTQRLANLIVLMKTCNTIQFMMEYLAYTSDARITTDDENVMGKPNFPNFEGNRHDQTVFSLLSKKWGVLELRNPIRCHKSGCEKGYRYHLGPYFQVYVHDRNRS